MGIWDNPVLRDDTITDRTTGGKIVERARARMSACRVAPPSGPASSTAMANEVSAALDVLEAENERLRAALKELADAAEHDMKMNQGGDNHEDEPEGSGGWWSTRTERAIIAARVHEQRAVEPSK